MGIFDKFFGGGEKKKVIRLIISKTPVTPPTPKERYESGKEWEAERAQSEAEDDPYRIEKSIKRHQKKSQKRR
ncbi:hypothetical protein H6F93_00580 [Leptolyngbya sp. FACHB-671]|uniref:hypothetical protein n=1 Tax=Leptolyngbya sp. FACHB-671 TaxID=2692812 RepID=UPI0016820451|nr:hypothetical protein [Leptolyngbya sp. FACHB-671]MBD2066046.1 hypothetical protein [Leptolyngbya sp. FACHB-671]